MRVTSMVPDIQYSMQLSEQQLATALQQVSTGKRVNQISDDPTASANNVRSLAASANVDQYTSNTSALLTRLQQADSSLSSVVTSLTQAITLGTEGANSTVNATNRQAIAAQVQDILTTVVAVANTSFQGSYLFAGTATTSAPFVASTTSATGYTYTGNSDVNQVAVGDSLSANANVPGDQLFLNTNVLGALGNLVTAFKSGTSADIGAASTTVSTALSSFDQQRTPLDNTISQLNAQESYLAQETVTLTTQQTSLTGIDLATAATNLAQAETAHSAVLAAAAQSLPNSLLNYLK
jgi:flagellar hook-associated protein 3 FlgL